MSMPPDAAGELEEVGTTHLESIGLKTYRSAAEVGTEEKYWEGSMRRVTVNAYERAPRARAACVAHYGVRCSVCDPDSGESTASLPELLFGDSEAFSSIYDRRNERAISHEKRG